jgi:hypothetical protein
MNSYLSTKNRLNKVLVAFILLNIIGDIGNVIFWNANPSSKISLVGGTLNGVTMEGGMINQLVGPDNALMIGSAVLLIVALAYIAALFGLLKEQKWAAMLIIAISVVNRVIAVFLFQFSAAFFFWLAWTVILVVTAFLDYRKLGAIPKTVSTTPAQPASST